MKSHQAEWVRPQQRAYSKYWSAKAPRYPFTRTRAQIWIRGSRAKDIESESPRDFDETVKNELRALGLRPMKQQNFCVRKKLRKAHSRNKCQDDLTKTPSADHLSWSNDEPDFQGSRGFKEIKQNIYYALSDNYLINTSGNSHQIIIKTAKAAKKF